MNTCETCGGKIVDHTAVCGAPQCCERCCEEATRQSLASEAEVLQDQLAAVTAERDALAAQLAALKKRVADAVKSHAVSPWGGLSKGYAVGARTVDKQGRYALVRLEDGE